DRRRHRLGHLGVAPLWGRSQTAARLSQDARQADLGDRVQPFERERRAGPGGRIAGNDDAAARLPAGLSHRGRPHLCTARRAVMGLVRLRKTDKGAWTPDGVKLAYGVAKAFIAAGGSSVAVPQSPAQTSQPASADPVPPAAGCDTGSLNTAVVNHANQVAYFYCLALNRLPNPTEQWRQALAMKQGRTVAEMMASVLETPEFSKVNGREEATNAAYIAAIYRRLLGREPDGRGLSDYLSR